MLFRSKNIDVVLAICKIMDRKKPRALGGKYADLIEFVEDRKGHDFRYAIDDTHAQKELGYQRRFKNFEEGLEHTVDWYLNNNTWVNTLLKSGKE